MNTVFKKLNLKDQKSIVILDAPGSFDAHIADISGGREIIRSLEGVLETEFVMSFVQKQAEIDELVPKVAPLLRGDAVLWMCYPKGSSKRYKCDFNRDTGWQIMGDYELEPVRMVAIDEDWSALRFKKVDFIKTMKRKALHALSEKGRLKAGQ